MQYTIKQLADTAGISVRTLHYYDEIGLLSPEYRTESGYRYYGEESALKLQQILFFRELGFSLEEIKKIITNPDFDIRQALVSHRELLQKRAAKIQELLLTIEKTMKKLKGETTMSIKDYYQGFSDAQIEEYRQEVKQRWGERTLAESESKALGMGKEKFAALQLEGAKIFQAIADNMSKGHDSPEIQELVGKWRQWLENYHHYSIEAV
ncbi:MAG: MerR family transcriptional regulator, partial [Dehalococcoidales bacterium]|nr:MerR family transcriptional regulator [Dehalococcoidales bacterium]